MPATRRDDECGPYRITPADPSVNVGPPETLELTNTVRAEHSGFVDVQDRLKSFQTWPMALQPRPEALATAGFFYSGQGDQCVCYHCGGGLKDWSESDDVWVEHAKYYPVCGHVIINKGQEFIDRYKTTATISQSVSTLSLNAGTAPIDNTTNNAISTIQSTFPSTSWSTSGCSTEEEASCIRKEATDLQIRSNGKIEEEETEELVRCEESAKDRKTEDLMCKICYQEERSVAFLPCGHVVACEKCACSLQRCAICRKEIKATVKVYLA